MKKILLPLVILVGLLFGAGAASAAPAAAPITLRAYPGTAAHAYPLDNLRSLQSLVLQNLAIVNTGGGPETLESLDLQLLAGGAVVDSRHLDGAALLRFAKGGQQLAASGALQMFAFQFGDVLGSPPADLASSATLAPGEALIVTQQVFAWRGPRDELRITVHGLLAGKPVGAVLSLKIIPLPAPTEARYVFPLEGRWYIGAGASFHTAHRWAVPEEFALDIVKVGDGGLTYRGAGAARTDYFAYGAPIRAAADGEVVAVVADQPEDDSWFRKPGESQIDYSGRVQGMQAILLSTGAEHAAGNYVIIRHPWGEYTMYAHLRPGSILVKAGDKVSARQPIAQIGTTGGSTEPHLHFQVCDGPTPLACAGIPPVFKDMEIPMADYGRSPQSGDFIEAH